MEGASILVGLFASNCTVIALSGDAVNIPSVTDECLRFLASAAHERPLSAHVGLLNGTVGMTVRAAKPTSRRNGSHEG